MGLLSFLKRRPGADAAAATPVESTDEVQLARTRARRRLIGASVLVIAGVAGFPLVFETQPRPVPVDIPIEIPRKDAAALPLPPARKPAATPVVPPEPKASAARAEPAGITTESVAEAGRDVTPPAAPAKPAAPAGKPPATTSMASAEAPKKAAASAPATPSDAQRAQALLEGRSGAKDSARPAAANADAAKDGAREAGRFVVQVGAFADAAAARETRGKVEKLGLKTYTQVIETPSGSRIRVRAGPFASRDEADKALARAKAAGLNAVVLTL